MNIETLGTIVKRRRKELGFDQISTAELAGISTHSLSDIESGKANPTLGVMTRVLDVLGLELVVRPRQIEPEPADG